MLGLSMNIPELAIRRPRASPSELIANGGFDSDLSGWVTSLGIWEDGRLKITADALGFDSAYQEFTTEVGKAYIAKAHHDYQGGADGKFRIFDSENSLEIDRVDPLLEAGIAQITFVADSTTTRVSLWVDSADGVGYFDNVSVRETL